MRPVLAVTSGDPAGIGPEVALKALRAGKLPSKNYLLIGALPVFETVSDQLGLSLRGLNILDITRQAQTLYEKLGRKSGPGVLRLEPGRVSLESACIAYTAVEEASRLAVAGKVQAIVTAPVNKTAMRLVDPRFDGHTELLAARARAKKFAMMFVGPKLKVTLVTIHVALAKVSSLIRRKTVLEKIELTHGFLKKYGVSAPRIAVCALNPHGRETGTEDEAEIRPAVKAAARKGIRAVGPLSADQLFFDAYEGRFDAVVSMYHDQGLAPFKMIAFRDGVNVTLGLPYVRTSPDHGTAFDIAYAGKADAASMQAALRLAEKLVRRHVHAN